MTCIIWHINKRQLILKTQYIFIYFLFKSFNFDIAKLKLTGYLDACFCVTRTRNIYNIYLTCVVSCEITFTLIS